MHFGLALGSSNALVLRAGFDQSLSAGGGGTQLVTDLTLGLGLTVERFTIDYAYHPYAGFTELSSHLLSLSYEFGLPVQ
jgi:hypothetical protein